MQRHIFIYMTTQYSMHSVAIRKGASIRTEIVEMHQGMDKKLCSPTYT